MNFEGKWQPFVGNLTSVTHNEWVDGELAQASERSILTCILLRAVLKTDENQQLAYERTLELLKTHPDLKAVMGSAMSTVPGAAAAIEERGLIGKVAAFGTCLPSVAGRLSEEWCLRSRFTSGYLLMLHMQQQNLPI